MLNAENITSKQRKIVSHQSNLIFPRPSLQKELPIMNVVTFPVTKVTKTHGCIGRRLERIFLFIWNIRGFSIYWHKIIRHPEVEDWPMWLYTFFVWTRNHSDKVKHEEGRTLQLRRNHNHHSSEDGKQPERKRKDRHFLIMEQNYSKDKRRHHSSWKKPIPKEWHLSTAERGSWGLWGGWESQGLDLNAQSPPCLLPQRSLECYGFAGPFLGKCLASLRVI